MWPFLGVFLSSLLSFLLGEQSCHIVHYIHSFVKANKISKVLSERGPSHLGHLSFYAFLREYKKKKKRIFFFSFFLLFSVFYEIVCEDVF